MNRIFKFIFLFIFLTSSADVSIGQSKNTFSIGSQTRVTPIYLLQNPSFGTIPNSGILPQLDKHLSGPGVVLGFNRNLNPNFEFSVSSCIRWDYLYDFVGFNGQQNPQYWIKTEKSIAIDNYLDVKYLWQGIKTRKSFGLGLALCGMGTSFVHDKVLVLDSTIFITSIKEDFVFPAVYATAGIKFWKKFYGEVKMGFCWDNPDQSIIKNDFFFPELRLSYDLFDF